MTNEERHAHRTQTEFVSSNLNLNSGHPDSKRTKGRRAYSITVVYSVLYSPLQADAAAITTQNKSTPGELSIIAPC